MSKSGFLSPQHPNLQTGCIGLIQCQSCLPRICIYNKMLETKWNINSLPGFGSDIVSHSPDKIKHWQQKEPDQELNHEWTLIWCGLEQEVCIEIHNTWNFISIVPAQAAAGNGNVSAGRAAQLWLLSLLLLRFFSSKTSGWVWSLPLQLKRQHSSGFAFSQ